MAKPGGAEGVNDSDLLDESVEIEHLRVRIEIASERGVEMFAAHADIFQLFPATAVHECYALALERGVNFGWDRGIRPGRPQHVSEPVDENGVVSLEHAQELIPFHARGIGSVIQQKNDV